MTRTMKYSGIDWIGEIPEGWDIAPIRHLYSERKQKVSDTVYKPLSVTKQGIVPQLDSAAKSDAHDDRKLVCIGDFAINSRSDRRGSCGISDYEGSISLINTVLQPKIAMTPKYFDWLFHTTMFADEFYKWGHGIVDDLWTTNWSDMKKIMVTLPSMSEQQKIADFLDEKCSHIDTVLEKTRTSIEEYKQLKQSVITQAVTKGIRPNRPMKDSSIEWADEIPEDWNISKANRFIASTQNGLSRRDLVESSGNIVLKLTNISSDSKLDLTVINRIQLTEQEINTYGLKDGDFLFVRVNGSKSLVGKCVIYHTIEEQVAYNDHIIRVRLYPNILKEYFYWYLLSNIGKAEIENHTATAAGQYTISASGLKDVTITVPSKQEQQEIVAYLDDKCSEIDKLIAKKEQLIEELETYKKSLIYEYVTGKKEVC